MNDVLDSLGERFQFYVQNDKNLIYTCNAVDKNLLCTVEWEDKRSPMCAKYHIGEVKKHIKDGKWIVIPNQTEHLPTCEKGPWQLIQDALTHSDGRISVEVFMESYTINHMSLTQCFNKVEEEDLGRLLDALVVLDGFC